MSVVEWHLSESQWLCTSMQDDSWAKYLKESMVVYLVVWNDAVISVDLPGTVELKVVETEAQAKSNTSSGHCCTPKPLSSNVIIKFAVIDTFISMSSAHLHLHPSLQQCKFD